MTRFFFILLCFSPSRVGQLLPSPVLVIWNVGQGQWVSAIENEHCLHFDAGGEQAEFKILKKLCAQKQNYFYLSHWDFDHLGFLSLIPRYLTDSCLQAKPRGQGSSAKTKILRRFADCPRPLDSTHEIRTRNLTASSNASSRVQVYSQQILIPGDSPITEENYWATSSALNSIKILILGHHGSRTSTGPLLISHLPRLKLAIASSRYARYGHPHAETILRLQKNKTPVITTEDWGHIGIEL